MVKELVKKYYSQQPMKEWRRLVRDPYHHLEFETSIHFIEKYITKGKGLVLDAGGGPGRYTIHFAKRGHDLILLDLCPEMIKIAMHQVKRAGIKHRVKSFIEGSIDDLSCFDDETFGTVLCLGGALSHLIDADMREKAVDELIRVARAGSQLFVSVIGKPAVLVSELVNFPNEIEMKEMFPRLVATGDYLGGLGFAPCHFFLPEELKTSFEKRDVHVLEMVGLEGLASGHPKETNRLARKYPKAWKNWWNAHLKTCTHFTNVGISEHFMLIGKKESS